MYRMEIRLRNRCKSDWEIIHLSLKPLWLRLIQREQVDVNLLCVPVI